MRTTQHSFKPPRAQSDERMNTCSLLESLNVCSPAYLPLVHGCVISHDFVSTRNEEQSGYTMNYSFQMDRNRLDWIPMHSCYPKP